MKDAKYKKIIVPHSKGEILIYAKPAHADALATIMEMKIYEGSKLMALIAEVYRQGKKDGAKAVFDGLEVLKKEIPHKNPGQPKKKKK